MSFFETFGKYVILEKLSAGGMAEVYLAKSLGASGIGKFVAMKRILPQFSDNKEFIEMFKEEAKIAVNLNHGNVVSIFDFGVERSQFYLVMEYVEGQNLRQVLNHIKQEGRDFTIDQIVYITKEVAAGLDHAHRCLDRTTGKPLNITHRDMSPQNIMVSFEGEVKIVDFGIAKTEAQVEETRAGTIKGKYGYMSPEQSEGLSVDLRTDIFSLGIVFWELLTKERLFTAGSEAAILKKVRDCQIPLPRKINPTIHPELERICLKSLTKDRTLRYQTAAAFHRDLNRFINTQYPEFSPHDFSIFIKSIYSEMYLENRKKLAQYAQSQNEKYNSTKVTETLTLSNAEEPIAKISSDEKKSNLESHLNTKEKKSDMEKGINQNTLSENWTGEDLERKLNSSQSKKIDIKELQTQKDPVTKTGSALPQKNRYQTQSDIKTLSRKQPQYIDSNLVINVLTTVIVLISGYWIWKNKIELKTYLSNFQQKFQSGSQKGNIDTSTSAGNNSFNSNGSKLDDSSDSDSRSSQKNQQVPINIQSTPQGAGIYINGQMIGVTPYIGSLDYKEEFRLTLTKEGYLPYSRPQERAEINGYSIQATLQPEPPMGFISLNVLNSSQKIVFSINGQRISKSENLDLYQIPANLPVHIVAQEPFTNRFLSQTVTVGVGQKKFVQFDFQPAQKRTAATEKIQKSNSNKKNQRSDANKKR